MKFSIYGDGKAIIETLNIGFEPLLTPEEYNIYVTIRKLKQSIKGYEHSLKIIKSKLLYTDKDSEVGTYKWFSNRKGKLKNH